MAIKTRDDVKQLGTILSVWAHPDDESFSCAGIMAAAIANGQRVVCVTATRGELGIQDESRWPAVKLGEIRTRELHASLKILGIDEHYFLNYPDGACDRVPLDEGSRQVQTFITKFQPDTILTFGPDGLTGHPDHQSVSKWVSAAVSSATHRPRVFHTIELHDVYEKYLKPADERLNIFFNIDKPPLCGPDECDICFACDKELCARKCAALQAMESQTEGLFKTFDHETVETMMQAEAFVLAS